MNRRELVRLEIRRTKGNATSEKERAAKLVDPGFGRIFTDHMAIVRYNQRTAGRAAHESPRIAH